MKTINKFCSKIIYSKFYKYIKGIKMRISRIENNSQTSFGIGYSEGLKNAADKLYCRGKNSNQEAFNAFYRKIKYMQENYGYDDYLLDYGNIINKKNKREPAIFVKEYNKDISILLFRRKSVFSLFQQLLSMNNEKLDLYMNKVKKIKNKENIA